MYLPDTNIISVPVSKQPIPEVADRLQREWAHVVVATPVLHEVRYGGELARNAARRKAIFAFVDLLLTRRILFYDTPAALWHAKERARLERLGLSPSFADGQIAAIAVLNDLTVVTRNVGHFDHFAGLRVARW